MATTTMKKKNVGSVVTPSLRLVSSAYAPGEAWWCKEGGSIGVSVHRRLHVERHLQTGNDTEDNGGVGDGSNSKDVASAPSLCILLKLTLPDGYPVRRGLMVDASIDDEGAQGNNASLLLLLRKMALNALPSLVATCMDVAIDHTGEESIFLVLSAAEEWIHNEWPQWANRHRGERQNVQRATIATGTSTTDTRSRLDPSLSIILGRRLIYSHHIIAKSKRSDIKALASDYNLTGFLKIGWPGLIIVEGLEEECQMFYDEIKKWSWKYLVVRGEQQEQLPAGAAAQDASIERLRRFSVFDEVEDMSVVAEACRQVGLEALFKTSMKQYDNSDDNYDTAGVDTCDGDFNSSGASSTFPTQSLYGMLVLVDHMNDGKAYRKWLRRTGRETGVNLLAKQFYKDGDYSKRPTILVSVVGVQSEVLIFMKRWRTSRVDVDSRGKACLERQMKVLVQGELGKRGADLANSLDWDKASTDDHFTITEDQLQTLLSSLGGEAWTEQLTI